MVDQIDELKRKYTDKYVVVDEQRPELARFRDSYGTVKTVNMSGRALVEFADYHLNIGWYDIDPSYLKLIDAPLPPKVKEAPAKAPAAKKPPGEPASAGGKPVAKPKSAATAPAAAAKPSTADILAKLRGGAAAKPAAGEAAPAAPAKPAAPKPAAAAPAAPAAKVDRSKMSVADMLAAARAGKAGGAATTAPAPAKPQAELEAVEETVEESPGQEVAAAPTASIKKSADGPIDKESMSIAQMCAWCREHDTK